MLTTALDGATAAINLTGNSLNIDFHGDSANTTAQTPFVADSVIGGSIRLTTCCPAHSDLHGLIEVIQ